MERSCPSGNSARLMNRGVLVGRRISQVRTTLRNSTGQKPMKDNYWMLPGHIARTPTLTGNEKILYAYLLSNPRASAAPNTQAMAEACGVDKTTTLLAIKGLEAARLLKVKRTNAKKLKRMVEISVCNGRASKNGRVRAR
jgi:hypothetical protein